MATPKKTTAKKVAPKKTVTKKAVAPKKATTVRTPVTPVLPKKKDSNIGVIAFLLLLGGLVIGQALWIFQPKPAPEKVIVTKTVPSENVKVENGVVKVNDETFVSVSELDAEFKGVLAEGSEFVTYGGQTWLPVEGSPVELIVLNDTTCGTPCDTTQAISAIQQNLTPALITRVVDIDSAEGVDLINTFEFTSVPAFVLGAGIETLERNGQRAVEQLGQILNEKEGLYAFTAQAGFPVGKFIVAPDIETDNEPTIGTGPIKVIEFTDYECPYCKRLHDQNKDLIQKLVDEGTISYTLKDFPLGFHKNAPAVHQGLNCVFEDKGSDAYFAMKNVIFDQQGVWSKYNVDQLNAFVIETASGQGSDITACLASADNTEIQGDIAEGTKYGVTGTPGLFVGKQFAPGAIGPDQLQALVDNEK